MNPLVDAFATQRFTWHSPLSPHDVHARLADRGLGRARASRRDKPLIGSLGTDRFVARKRVAVRWSAVVPELQARFGPDGEGSAIECRFGPPLLALTLRVLFPPILLGIVLWYAARLAPDQIGRDAAVASAAYLALLATSVLGALGHRRFIRECIADELRIVEEAPRAAAG